MTPREIDAAFLAEAWDRLDQAIQRVTVSLPSQITDAVAAADRERLAMRSVVQSMLRSAAGYVILPVAEVEAARETGRVEMREKAATLVEAHDEVVNLKTGQRSLEERTEGNLVGLAYADAIRAMKGAKP